MTTVNVTSLSNTVVVTEGTGEIVTVSAPSAAVTVETIGVGPQGPQGPQGVPGSAGLVVNDTAKVNKSIVYYDSASGTFKADTTWTTDTIVDGANF
jgi:hypothetical protein